MPLGDEAILMPKLTAMDPNKMEAKGSIDSSARSAGPFRFRLTTDSVPVDSDLGYCLFLNRKSYKSKLDVKDTDLLMFNEKGNYT